tara:strand:+ start:330 stop:962 length:633 start_codon:yes stop_codon:yes gene_type:complete
MSKNFIERQYRKFSGAEGSQYIASEYALFRILNLVQKFQPRNILEVGVGIGTITDSILKSGNRYQLKVFGTEDNEFCRSQLANNLGSSFQELQLFRTIQELPGDQEFDMIIIDGKDSSLQKLKAHMSDRCILVIEGDRKDQTDLVRKLLPDSKFVHSITSKRNNSYSNRPQDHFQGGLKIIFTNPNLKQNIVWMKLILATKMHFQLRKLV